MDESGHVCLNDCPVTPVGSKLDPVEVCTLVLLLDYPTYRFYPSSRAAWPSVDTPVYLVTYPFRTAAK